MPVEQPMLSDLMAAYLRRLAASPQTGLVSGAAREVEPYDAVPTQVLDPVQTWAEATVALREQGIESPAESPSIWASVVFGAEAATAVPMAAGHFPQAVRDLAQLARSVEGQSKPQPNSSPLPIDGLDNWIGETSDQSTASELCVAAGLLRLARRPEDAERLLRSLRKSCGKQFVAAIDNEIASTMWARGERAEAVKVWDSLPESVPVLFNRGMSALFTGIRQKARENLVKAIATMDDGSGWRHLARLYMALAESE